MKGRIESDDARLGSGAPAGFDPSHVLFFGRKDNFWEMAETGPCGPNSEIHIDLGPGYCERERDPGHTCGVNVPGCTRFVELWNLVFIQYNRSDPNTLEPLPSKHVDTGMGLERTAAVMQGVDSNYKTDLLSPMMDAIQALTGQTDEQREANITPYRVSRPHPGGCLLIADVVRQHRAELHLPHDRAAGGPLRQPDRPEGALLARIAQAVIENYGPSTPSWAQPASHPGQPDSQEVRFQRTVEGRCCQTESLLARLRSSGDRVLSGEQPLIYTPLTACRRSATSCEQSLEVDESGFLQAMEDHRLASGAGEAFGPLGDEGVELYRQLLEGIKEEGALGPEGVEYNPYGSLEVEGPVVALVKDGRRVEQAGPGEQVEVVLPETSFYVAAGGQVADTGTITSAGEPRWEIRVTDTRRPMAGLIVMPAVVAGTLIVTWH
jgi:alanyl-tRNA synthetase